MILIKSPEGERHFEENNSPELLLVYTVIYLESLKNENKEIIYLDTSSPITKDINSNLLFAYYYFLHDQKAITILNITFEGASKEEFKDELRSRIKHGSKVNIQLNSSFFQAIKNIENFILREKIDYKKPALWISFSDPIIILNDIFKLSKPNPDSGNYKFFKFMFENQNRVVTTSEIQKQINQVIRPVREILKDIGFVNDLKIFFLTSKESVMFKNPLFEDDLKYNKIELVDISAKLQKIKD